MILTPITNPTALRLDATVGTRIFSGTTMVYGDTGWRSISSTKISAGTVHLRRIGQIVYLRIGGLRFTEAAPTLDLAPIGFRPDQIAYGQTIPYFSWSTQKPYRVTTNGALVFPSGTLSDDLVGSLAWPTNDAWPTTLPGLPA